jgi:hypothetical protein
VRYQATPSLTTVFAFFVIILFAHEILIIVGQCVVRIRHGLLRLLC